MVPFISAWHDTGWKAVTAATISVGFARGTAHRAVVILSTLLVTALLYIMAAAQTTIADYREHCNKRGPHQALDYGVPAEIYYDQASEEA